MSAATPQEGILILLKISIALRFEPYRRSGKLGLYHMNRIKLFNLSHEFSAPAAEDKPISRVCHFIF